MTFTRQAKPILGKLAEAFPGKVINEMSYRELRSVMATAPEQWRPEAVAAAAIGVDLEEILTLPGRFSGALGDFIRSVMEMHGLSDANDSAPDNIEGLAVSPPKH